MANIIKKFLMKRYKANPQKVLTIAREENLEVERFIHYLSINLGSDDKLNKEVKKRRISKDEYNKLFSSETIKQSFSY
jgi:hypothetical protein